MDKQMIKSKIEKLLSFDWITKDLRGACIKYLEVLDTDNENKERIIFMKVLDDSICTIEELEAFANSPKAEEFFKDVEGFRKHVNEMKEAHELYCDCEACTAALDVLNILKDIK